MRWGLDADINNIIKKNNSKQFPLWGKKLIFAKNLDEKVPKAHQSACCMSRLFNLCRNGVNKKRCNLTKVFCQRAVSLRGVVLWDG